MSARAAFCLATCLVLIQWNGGAQALSLDKLAARSTMDPKVSPRPATVQLQDVTGGSGVYSVSAALKYRMDTGDLDLAPFVEWQRNTADKAEQNLLKIGGVADWQILDLGPGGHGASPWLLAVTNWKRDRAEDEEGAQLAVSATGIFREHDKDPSYWYVPGLLSETKVLAWRYLPYIGFESAVAKTQAPQLRGVAGVQVQLYPVPAHWRYDVQLTVDAFYRRSGRDEVHGGRDTRKIDVGLNYFPVRQRSEDEPDRAFGIGLLYSYGSDPQGGTPQRELRQLALSVIF